jgi:hypothetical protein
VAYRVTLYEAKANSSEIMLVLEADGSDPKRPALAQERIEIGPNSPHFERRTGPTPQELSFVHRYIFARAK